MDKSKFLKLAEDIMIDIVGGILIAVGVYNFASAAKFPMTGFNGIALIFYHLFGTPIGTVTMLLNIPVAFITYPILGKRFFLRSVRSIIITSVIMDVVAPLFPIYTGDRMLAAIFCGILPGLGLAMIYMRDSSTGGADFIILATKAKYPHISIGKISFISDFIIVLLGAAVVSRDMESLMYGVLIAYLLSVAVDKLMYGIDQGKVSLIVTEHGPEICEKIDEILGRGSTILKGVGSYSKQERDVVMCACNNKQMYGIRRLVKEIDPKSFLVIMESNDVVGEGFKSE